MELGQLALPMVVPYSTIIQLAIILTLSISTVFLLVVLVIVYCKFRAPHRLYVRWIEPMANVLTFIFVIVRPTNDGSVNGTVTARNRPTRNVSLRFHSMLLLLLYVHARVLSAPPAGLQQLGPPADSALT